MSDTGKCKNNHEFPKDFKLDCSECINLKMKKIFNKEIKIKD